MEWAASGIGLVLALSMLGVIAWDAWQGTSDAPAVSVKALEIVETDAGYTVRIRVTNVGDETASDVVVEGELRRDDQPVETSETTFAYVPGRSERDGGLFFSEDPRSFSLELRAHGYTAP